jgi:hypothetical protein
MVANDFLMLAIQMFAGAADYLVWRLAKARCFSSSWPEQFRSGRKGIEPAPGMEEMETQQSHRVEG